MPPEPGHRYSYFLGRVVEAERDRPGAAGVAAACAALEEMSVGVTEQMDSFLVLIALENGRSLLAYRKSRWPLHPTEMSRMAIRRSLPFELSCE